MISQSNGAGNSAPKTQTPVSRFFTYKSGKGAYAYWDKDGIDEETGEKGVEVLIDKLEFIALDAYGAASGFSSELNGRIKSNEVYPRNLRKEELDLFVMKKKGESFKRHNLIKGIWADIKGAAKEGGAKYTSVVYGLMDGELIRVEFVGAGSGAWVEFSNEADTTNKYVSSQKSISKKTGPISFNVPELKEGKDITDEELAVAKDMLAELNEYKAQYNQTNEAVDTEEDLTF